VADAPARNGNVDGQVTAAVRLAPTGTTANISNVGINDYTATVDPSNGRFVFRNVQAGAYELFTTYNGLNGRIEIEVRDSDIENANLTLAPGFDLQVRMLAERGPSGEAPPVAQLRPYLGDDPPSPRDAFLGEASPDGMTTIKNLVPDNYRFYLEPLLNSVIAPSRAIPPALQDVYVKSVLFGQSDALNAPLHYTGQTETTLDIILGSNPGALEGQVLDAKGMPARGAVVTLLPNVPAQNRVFRMDMFRSVVSDTEGRFRIRGIPPGDYKIFAWAGLERDAWMDPDLQRAYESRAVILKVEERSAVTVELRVIVPGL
jgi:hypothetical protein